MNNWRLLLLALFAVVQPIASFTEGNFDGRHQCCDVQSRPSFRDSRVPLYGSDRFAKTTEELRLSQQDKIREDRRHEIKQYGLTSSGLSSDVSLLRTRDRVTKEVTPRSLPNTGSENRLERISNDHNRRLLSGKESRIVGNTRYIQREEQNRRVVREYRSQNEKVAESSRLSRDRDLSRFKRVNKRLSEYSPESRRETRRIQVRSQELRRDSPNRETRIELRRTRDNVARIPEDASIALGNRQQVMDRLDVGRRERLVNVEVSHSFDNNNERRVSVRRTSANEERRLLAPDTQALNDVQDIRERLNSRKERRGNANARLTRTARFDERRQQGKYIREFRGPVSRATDTRFERHSENRNELRNDEIRFTENRDERIRTNLREDSFEGRHSKQRTSDNHREIRHNLRDVRDGSVKEIRNNERPIKENREARISNQRRVRDDERRSLERNSESRREIRSSEAIRDSRRDTRDDERRFRDKSSEIRREIRSAERINTVRDNERHVRERTDESRRESRSAEQMKEIRDNEKRVREMNSEIRREVRNAERMAENRREIRDDETRFSENRKPIIIRYDERLVRERNNVIRREIRSAERINNIRESESRREIRSVDTIRGTQRETRDNERRLRVNINNERRSIQNRNLIRNNRRVIRDDERRFRDTESRMEIRRYSERKVRENQDVRREIRNNQDLREIRDTRSTNGRSLVTKNSKALQRENLVLDRRTRSIELGNIRGNKAEIRVTRSDVSRERDVSHIRIKFLNNDKTTERETVNTRHRNVESSRNHDTSESAIQKANESVDESVIAYWQYVFYTLQGIYLCGLLMQILTPRESEKLKTGNWWYLKSQRLIKVD